jgi:enoyl-CoA hydratase
MKNFEFELKDGIGILSFAREKVLNALNRELLTEGIQFIEEVRGQKRLKVLVLTGKGSKAFVAGADIGELSEADSFLGRELSRFGQSFMQALDQFPVPVIAAINGFALGGGLEVALACDLRFASSKAKLGLPEVSLGLIPGYGGTQRLTRIVGEGIAREMVFSGEMITAERAAEIGLVNQVFAPESLMDEVIARARVIADRAPLALQAAKRSINLGKNLDLSSALEVESAEFGFVCSTHDKREGTQAFLEKRKAKFEGV